MFFTARAFFLVLVLALGAGCGGDDGTPVGPTVLSDGSAVPYGAAQSALGLGSSTANSMRSSGPASFGDPSSAPGVHSASRFVNSSSIPAAVQELTYFGYGSTIVLSWDPPPGDAESDYPARNYPVNRDGSRVATMAATSCSYSGCSYTDSVDGAGVYTYTVWAVNASSDAGPSTDLSVVVGASFQAPFEILRPCRRQTSTVRRSVGRRLFQVASWTFRSRPTRWSVTVPPR